MCSTTRGSFSYGPRYSMVGSFLRNCSHHLETTPGVASLCLSSSQGIKTAAPLFPISCASHFHFFLSYVPPISTISYLHYFPSSLFPILVSLLFICPPLLVIWLFFFPMEIPSLNSKLCFVFLSSLSCFTGFCWDISRYHIHFGLSGRQSINIHLLLFAFSFALLWPVLN